MLENEDSVVTSLNELRKLKNERITRQGQSRSLSRHKRIVAPADDPAADQPTPGPVVAQAVLGSGQASAAKASAAFAPAPFATSNYDMAPVSVPTMVRTKTSYAAAAVVAVLMAGAGAAGYSKLQSDTKSLLEAKSVSIRQAEEARGKAVEQAAKSEQSAKSNLRQCEDKLKAALAVAPPVSVPSQALAPAAKKPAKAAVRGRFASKASSKVVRQTAKAEPVKQKSEPAPLIAKKKNPVLDPLDGIGK